MWRVVCNSNRAPKLIAVHFFFAVPPCVQFQIFIAWVCVCVSLSTKSPSPRLPHCIFGFKLNYIKIKLEFVVVILVFCTAAAAVASAVWFDLLQSSCLLLMLSKIFCKNIKYNLIPFVQVDCSGIRAIELTFYNFFFRILLLIPSSFGRSALTKPRIISNDTDTKVKRKIFLV